MPDVGTAVSRALGHFTLEDLISALMVLAVCIVVVKLLLKLIERLLGKRKTEARVRRVVLLGAKTVLYTVTVVVTAGTLGVDLTSLVALLSVGSLGVTLAMEDILANMAGGLVIFTSHPFAIGDYIEADGTTGNVEHIALNHTRLLTPDGYTALLPNKTLASSKVINYTTLGKRRITRKIPVPYKTPADTVKEACREALRETPNLLDDPQPTIFLTNFGESCLEYTVYCWTKTPDWWTTQFLLTENLWKAFSRRKMEIPFHQLDVHIKDLPREQESSKQTDK